jgi:hypothetical protein
VLKEKNLSDAKTAEEIKNLKAEQAISAKEARNEALLVEN